MVARVTDAGARLPHPLEAGRIVIEATEDHRQGTVTQRARHFKIVFEDHEGRAGAAEFLDDVLDRRTITIEEHFSAHRGQLVGQADFETFLEVGQDEHGEDQEHQELPHELTADHEQGDEWVLPVAIVAVTGGGQGFRSPLQTFEKGPRRAFEVLHAQHVKRTHDQDGNRQQGEEGQEALGRSAQAKGRNHDERIERPERQYGGGRGRG